LGWTPIVPAHIKSNIVIYNKVREEKGKKLSVLRLPDESELDFVEHRTMVALCLPKIDCKSSDPVRQQIRKDPMSSWTSETLKIYTSKKYIDLLNALNLAFNIFNSIPDGKTRASPEHFKNVRGEVLKRSAFVPLIDASGKEYSKFSELPEHIRAFFNKEYHFKHGVSKRPREKISEDTSMQVDHKDQPAEKVPEEPVSKKKRVEINQPLALPEVPRVEDPRLGSLREPSKSKPSEKKASSLARERGSRPRQPGGGSTSK
jgi:hypothetical protein